MFDQVSSGRKKVSPNTTPSPKAGFHRVSAMAKPSRAIPTIAAHHWVDGANEP